MPNAVPMRVESGSVVHSDPEIPGGTPVFRGTRVPVRSLFDYLEGSETIEQFLDQTLAALDLARDALLPVRVLHDENLPRAFGEGFARQRVSTVQAGGWSGTTNGELLRQANQRVDVLLTLGRGLQFQQNNCGHYPLGSPHEYLPSTSSGIRD